MADETAVTWFRSRLLPAVAGLLSEQEAERFKQLAEEDPVCRTLVEAFEVEHEATPHVASTDRHIPAAILARWSRAQRELSGLERNLVAQHLAACEECRSDLHLVGFEPTLDAAELQPTAGLRDNVHRRDPVRWGLFTWATLATAASIVLLVLPMSRGIGTIESARSVAPTSAGAKIDPLEVLRLRAPSRSGESDAYELHVRPHAPLRVSFPNPPAPEGHAADSSYPIRLELRDPVGAVVIRQVVSSKTVTSDKYWEIVQAAPWVTGTYIFAVTAVDDRPAYEFAIQVVTE